MTICNSPTSGAAELSVAVLNDPGLTLQLLRNANAAFYASARGKILIMRRALVVLGLDEIDKTIRAMPQLPVRVPASAAALAKDPTVMLLGRSALAGALANELAVLASEEPQGAAACAMLHNLGLLLVGLVHPRASSILWTLRGRRVATDRMGKRLVGWRPAQLGVAAARMWNLPVVIRFCMLPPGGHHPVPVAARTTVALCRELQAWLGAAEQEDGARGQQEAHRHELKKAIGASSKDLEQAVRKGIVGFQDTNPFLYECLWRHGLLPRLML